RFGRLQPRTSSSADASQRARCSCSNTSKRLQKGRQKGTQSRERNVMSIIRHEIRQITDENRGQPIISQAVVHGNVAYFAGITPNPIVAISKPRLLKCCDVA